MSIANYLMPFVIVIGIIYPLDRRLQDVPDSTRYAPVVRPDVAKPHSSCPVAECWNDCIDQGYDNTSTQAASANVIYYLCRFWCFPGRDDIYHGLVDLVGNVGQFPEEQKQSMLDWVSNNCPQCSLSIKIAHKGYANQNPVDPQDVTFKQAHWGMPFTEHVIIWVVSERALPFPSAPTGKGDLSQALTYLGTTGGQIIVHDPDCNLNSRGNNFYQIASDRTGEYLKDYFGPGNNGYLHGVIVVTGRR